MCSTICFDHHCDLWANLCRRLLFVGVALLVGAVAACAASVEVDVDKPQHEIPTTLWGIFFEDINLSADGGIYAELVRNRSFEDSDKPENWSLVDGSANKTRLAIDTSRPLNPMNRRSLRIDSVGSFSLENLGYWGMNAVAGEAYKLRFSARVANNFVGPLTAQLVSQTGKTLATAQITDFTDQWREYVLELTPKASDAQARLQFSAKSAGTLFLDMVSLVPEKTWNNHGMRPDLCTMLSDLQPSFFRFPGGCWVEGDDFAHMYKWKETIGDISQRKPLFNIWGYWATHGLGYHEYLQMSEDLGATPLFCINCGMSHKEVVPMEQMGQWVQDALDAIEYANGPVDSVWGALRAENGHPEPFNMEYLEIGNENGNKAYADRWPLFVKAIKKKYPEMKLIANHWAGGFPTNPMPAIVDEHYYNTPEFFMQQASRYDQYDRSGPQVFVGEFAVTQNGGQGNLRAAIGEAAFMTGVERNSDVVKMACYAPLLVNTNHRRWNPDLINFDSARAYGIPGYYVQKLFSEHRGDVVLPTAVEADVLKEEAPSGCIGVGTWNTAAEFRDIKVTAPNREVLFSSDFGSNTDGWDMRGDGAWQIEKGVLRQSAQREFVRALAGDKSWTDYTLELKARKLAGREGFLILFQINDHDDRIWWNIGGWNNTRHAIELGGIQDPQPGAIETGKWYDIRVEIRGYSVKCFLDGKLIHDIKNTQAAGSGLFASATLDRAANEVIVKVVNAAAKPTDTEISLRGITPIAGPAKLIVLTSDLPTDENSLDEPTKVIPQTKSLSLSGPQFRHQFPGNSLTIVRVPVKK